MFIPTSRRTVLRAAAVAVLCLGLTTTARADVATTLIDFENLPPLPAQPNNFLAAGGQAIFVVPLAGGSTATISGGVVLGNPVFLPAFLSGAAGSRPNLYGTADFASPSLQPALTLDFPAEAS